MPKLYTDIDYESFPVADLFLDLHWIQLPQARYREILKAQREVLEAARLEELPPDHKVILVPADSDYSPSEEELWPVINHTVQEVLALHPAVHGQVVEAVNRALAAHRGWRNPYPASLDYEPAKK